MCEQSAYFQFSPTLTCFRLSLSEDDCLKTRAGNYRDQRWGFHIKRKGLLGPVWACNGVFSHKRIINENVFRTFRIERKQYHKRLIFSFRIGNSKR